MIEGILVTMALAFFFAAAVILPRLECWGLLDWFIDEARDDDEWDK